MAQLSDRVHAVRSLAARELRSGLLSAGVYVPVSIGFIISSFVVRNYIKTIEGNGMMMLSNPLNQPLYWCIIVAAIYLALSSAISIAKEKEQGTLEILFHGPVDMESFVVSKFAEHLVVYVVFAVLFTAFFWITSLLTNFGMGVSFLTMILSSIVLSACTISFGTLVSALAPKIKNATFIFLGLVVLFLTTQVLGQVLSSVQPDDFSTFAAYLRVVVEGITQLLSWVSPFDYVTRGMNAIMINNPLSLLYSLLEAVAYVVVTLYLSIIILKSKGAKRA